MFVIAVYDISGRKVVKVLKKSREYLTWVQNSVFEGEITTAKFEKLKLELRRIIDKKKDSVILRPYKGAATQKWKVKHDGGPFFTIHSSTARKLLTAPSDKGGFVLKSKQKEKFREQQWGLVPILSQ